MGSEHRVNIEDLLSNLKLSLNTHNKLNLPPVKTKTLYNLPRILTIRCQFLIYGFLDKKKKCF